jgi:RHS repeat-associated protein
VTARREGYTSIVAEWQGTDSGSGIRSYDVQYAVDSPNNWQDWRLDTPQTQTSFGGEFGHSYYFQIKARDRAGNESDWVQVGPISVELGAVKKYYSFGGSRIAMREGSEVYYLSGDHLGSVSLTTDSSGAIVAESRYLPYGEVWWSSGTLPTDFGFTGQRGTGFGLMDYNARMYSPALGRFISADMIVPEPGSSQDWNRYSYVYNNPVKYTDPSGYCIPGLCPGQNVDYYNSVMESSIGVDRYNAAIALNAALKDAPDIEPWHTEALRVGIANDAHLVAMKEGIYGEKQF